MENEEPLNTTLSMSQSSSFFDNQNKLMLNKTERASQCQCGNQAYYICIQKGCQSQAFICQSSQCILKFHQNCYKIQLKIITSKIQKKIIGDVSQYVLNHDKMVDAFIDKIIDQASKMKDLYKQYAEKVYKYSQLNQTQKKIWMKLQDSKINQMKGFQFSLLFTELLQKPLVSPYICNLEQSQKKWFQAWSTIQNDAMQSLKQLQFQLLSDKKRQIIFKTKAKTSLFQTSNIIKNLEEEQTMLKIIDRKVKSVQLLYKASQNQFKLDKFKKNCINIQNTLVLIHTEFDKKVGGFTPLKWKKVQQQQHLADDSNSSFLFSLTNNQKLTQTTQTESGIWNVKDLGPAFGSKGFYDIYIKNQANKDRLSIINFSRGYNNQMYKEQSKQTYERFCGNPDSSYYAKLKQWQVWRVIFQ